MSPSDTLLALLRRGAPAPPNLDLRAHIDVLGSRLEITVRTHPRARRYILRLDRDGSVVLTLPRRGTAPEAARFLQSNLPWLEKRLLAHRRTPRLPLRWTEGTRLLLHGERHRLERDLFGAVLGPLTIPLDPATHANPSADLRPPVEAALRTLASRELPARARELATHHGLPLRRTSIRNQRSRWGSCNSKGLVCLNWRLVQASPLARDYVILHELAHLRHLDHSRRFWAEVARLCPRHREGQAWLRSHAPELGM